MPFATPATRRNALDDITAMGMQAEDLRRSAKH
jgi:hypothetical protein